MIRSYQSRGRNVEEFLEVVVKAIGLEFNKKVSLENIDDNFVVSMDSYKMEMTKELAEDLKSPYGLDRHILEEFRKQGFEFEISRSQYIQYCYGNYIGAEVSNKDKTGFVKVDKLKTDFPN